jgi:hypothetical protein
MTLEDLETIKAEMCDKYCRYPFTADQEYLDKKCAECPLERIQIDERTNDVVS